jgi:NAD(P)-dependent dehydrogenase (short-subunit alcohol dehydrogenase family)
MMPSFAGKVALVTGGTSGIGRSTAIALARAGAHVVITGRREIEGEQVLQQIHEAGAKGLFMRSDVTHEADLINAVEQTVATFGRLDIAFNNAGIEGVAAPLVDTINDNFDAIMSTNVRGVFLSMKYEIAQMQKSGGGAIVNNASMGGLIGFKGLSAYIASKHAVLGLTKTAALEVLSDNIRVNAICPGLIDTAIQDRLWGNDEQAKIGFAAQSPAGRLGTPEEVAASVVYLCSDAASFVTGHSLVVDGAYIVQ